LTNLPGTIALALRYSSCLATAGVPNMYTFWMRPNAPRFASSFKQEKMTLAPNEKPTSVTGRVPRLRSMRESARISPAMSARACETIHGLSIKYDSFVKARGSVMADMSAVKSVLPSTCCKPCVRAYPASVGVIHNHHVWTHLSSKDVDSVTHAPQHLRFPKHRVNIAHNGIHSTIRQPNIVHFTVHPSR
jgi:hypothetical protein